MDNIEQKKTKIICTISDFRCSEDFIRDLYRNGMNVVRINSAHATIEGAQTIVDNVRKVSDRIAILIDTKGPEVRLTAMKNSVGFPVKENDIITIGNDTKASCRPGVLYTNCASFVDDVPVGADILIDDGSTDRSLDIIKEYQILPGLRRILLNITTAKATIPQVL